jgi:hypothetical protein
MARAHRVRCDSKCLLNYKGSQYSVVLENISITGALLTLDSSMMFHPEINKTCGLMLCNDPTLCPPRHPCRIVRYADEDKVGIQFLDMVWNSGLA